MAKLVYFNIMGQQPDIILVVTGQETKAQIRKQDVSFIEVRVDLFKRLDMEHVVGVFKEYRSLNIPLLLTVRSDKKEGAQKPLTEQKKWVLLNTLMPLTDWVDIELSSPLCRKTIDMAHQLKKKVVVSAHDFKAMPKDLEILYKKAKKVKADAVKFAFCAKSEEDILRLIDLTAGHRQDHIVTMCVGEWGPLSRLILPMFGSRWVYVFLNESTAPGQMNIQTYQQVKKMLAE